LKHRTLERTLAAANVLAFTTSIAFALLAAPSTSSPPRPPLEIWGLGPDDQLEIDGASVPVKGGSTPRVFSGDPSAANAPILRELTLGKHEVVVRRPGCATRTFAVEMAGAHKRTIVFAPASPAHCGIPAPPARAP
jgi:hypothetical protein